VKKLSGGVRRGGNLHGGVTIHRTVGSYNSKIAPSATIPWEMLVTRIGRGGETYDIRKMKGIYQTAAVVRLNNSFNLGTDHHLH
jgi:hypothetical protein